MLSFIHEEILRLKEDRHAIILAHNYQTADVQDIADLTGDSLELSRAAATMEGDVIVFCGVDFMAETAAIISPDKTVLLPASDACCPMADMITADELKLVKSRHPDAAVVCYVNTTAEVKAESDICCTSSNAVKVVNSVKEDQIIFVPDRNLGLYTQRFTKKEILPWEGFCIVHDQITPDHVREAQESSSRCNPPGAPGVPPGGNRSCRPCREHIRYHQVRVQCPRKRSSSSELKIGILHRLERECPTKKCYPLSPAAICRT